MDKDRSAVINIGGEEYALVLTTKAEKEIAGRYGGLENLGDTLSEFDEKLWLTVIDTHTDGQLTFKFQGSTEIDI